MSGIIVDSGLVFRHNCVRLRQFLTALGFTECLDADAYPCLLVRGSEYCGVDDSDIDSDMLDCGNDEGLFLGMVVAQGVVLRGFSKTMEALVVYYKGA